MPWVTEGLRTSDPSIPPPFHPPRPSFSTPTTLPPSCQAFVTPFPQGQTLSPLPPPLPTKYPHVKGETPGFTTERCFTEDPHPRQLQIRRKKKSKHLTPWPKVGCDAEGQGVVENQAGCGP
eukprot:756067-Hanusia_phi.AAC.2